MSSFIQTLRNKRTLRHHALAALMSVAFASTATAQSGLESVLSARPNDFVEGAASQVVLGAQYAGSPTAHEWSQTAGPRVVITDLGPGMAVASVGTLEVAVDTRLVFELSLTYGTEIVRGNVSVHVRPLDLFPVLGPHVQVGGATTAATVFNDGTDDWALFNVGGRFSATLAGASAAPVYSIQVQGLIHDVLLVDYSGTRYALLATGNEGIAIVDIDDPTQMEWKGNVGVNYYKDGLRFAEGGGAILHDQVISGTKGAITALESDGTTLWIANADYGLHRTNLAKLLGAGGPVLEPDGTLNIEREAYTLQYAGETPWGGPLSLDLVEGKLFVALQFLGLGIFDSAGLDLVGRYNMYTDLGVLEDWFIDLDVEEAVQRDFVDPVTGMPDYRQASFEILNSHGTGGGGGNFATPWADFDRYGKYYYNVQDVDVVRYSDNSMAYIAYGLGGLVAVDVTGFENATEADFLEGRYLGYAPGVPAHGPDEFIGSHNSNIFPHFGAERY